MPRHTTNKHRKSQKGGGWFDGLFGKKEEPVAPAPVAPEPVAPIEEPPVAPEPVATTEAPKKNWLGFGGKRKHKKSAKKTRKSTKKRTNKKCA